MRSDARRFLPVVILALSTAVCAQAPARIRWSNVLDQPAAWYASDEARQIADTVLRYQRESGGWPKDVDMTASPASPAPARPDATIDNAATTTQIRLLARVGGKPEYLDAGRRGIDYLLAAQYPNGGWPQYFPLRKDYSRHITFNDNAIANVLAVLGDVAQGKGPFAFVDEKQRARAADAVRRAVPMILKTQVVLDGTPTAWSAQHDEVTLEPRPARAFEPVALSAHESVGLVRFLMRQPVTPEIVRAVDGAVTWLRAVRLPDGRWARFYEIGTNRPIFAGRDGIVRYKLEEIDKERREGYAWYGTWPRDLIERQYPAWKKSNQLLP